MKPFLERANEATMNVVAALQAFRSKVSGASPSHELPKDTLARLGDLADECLTALAAISFSLELIRKTKLDIVDMETRMQNETGRLAGLLKDLGETVGHQHFIRKAFDGDLLPVEEAVQKLSAALFPSAVQGLNKVNSQLWQVTNLQMTIFRDRLKHVGKNLAARDKKTVEDTFALLDDQFGNVNEFLNQLAERALTNAEVLARRKEVLTALSEAHALATKSLADRPFKEFKDILKEIASQARSLPDLLKFLRIPLFPEHDAMKPLDLCISDDLYASLTGLETFALLNIAARMRSITLGSVTMLDKSFGIEVFDVFPDRIYFHANESLVKAVAASGLFAQAPAGLHKFNDGSFKQTKHGQGNLQISFTNPDENGRIKVDADIDLYRDPLLHFFGEVVVNHLTGKKTDAYKVLSILAEQDVTPIGDFDIVSV
jgi:hypothetical protein